MYLVVVTMEELVVWRSSSRSANSWEGVKGRKGSVVGIKTSPSSSMKLRFLVGEIERDENESKAWSSTNLA